MGLKAGPGEDVSQRGAVVRGRSRSRGGPARRCPMRGPAGVPTSHGRGSRGEGDLAAPAGLRWGRTTRRMAPATPGAEPGDAMSAFRARAPRGASMGPGHAAARRAEARTALPQGGGDAVDADETATGDHAGPRPIRTASSGDADRPGTARPRRHIMQPPVRRRTEASAARHPWRAERSHQGRVRADVPRRRRDLHGRPGGPGRDRAHRLRGDPAPPQVAGAPPPGTSACAAPRNALFARIHGAALRALVVAAAQHAAAGGARGRRSRGAHSRGTEAARPARP